MYLDENSIFICRSIQATQVISLSLSDELMPNQVQLFHQHFPQFHKQFHRLQTLKYLDTSTVLPNLPSSLSSLSIKTYLKTKETAPLILKILNEQSPYLTSLQIDGSYIFRSIDYSFPLLTHLIIGYCTIKEFDRILHSLQSPLTHLKVFLDQDETTSPLPNFEQLSNTLIDLTLTFSEGKTILFPFFLHLNFHLEIIMSFELIKQWIIQLPQLTCLTIQTTCTLDLMNGQLWENYLRQTKNKKFNFKFILANRISFDDDQDSLLRTFRSIFWMKRDHWHVVCEKGQLKSSRPILYSIPYFQPICIFYPSNLVSSKSTNEGNIWRSKHRVYLILTFFQTIPVSDITFDHVHSLTLLAPSLPSIELLQSIVNLQQVRQLDVSSVKTLSLNQFQILINRMINLKTIRMQYNPFFLSPLHIDSYVFIRDDQDLSVIDLNNLQRFSYLFYHLKYLEITIQSAEIVIALLNRLHYLETIRIFSYQNDLTNIKYQWFIENIPRLKTLKFTYRITPTCLVLAIGDRKVKSFFSSSQTRIKSI